MQDDQGQSAAQSGGGGWGDHGWHATFKTGQAAFANYKLAQATPPN